MFVASYLKATLGFQFVVVIYHNPMFEGLLGLVSGLCILVNMWTHQTQITLNKSVFCDLIDQYNMKESKYEDNKCDRSTKGL